MIKKTLTEEAQSNISEIEQFKNQRLTIWKIRWYITFILYIIFWHIEWVRWTLFLTIPLSFYCLYMILFGFHKVLKKYEQLQEKIENDLVE